jgi:dUTP pyrophosphatase
MSSSFNTSAEQKPKQITTSTWKRMGFIFEYSVVNDNAADVYKGFEGVKSADNAGVDLHCVCDSEFELFPGAIYFINLGVRGRLVDAETGEQQHYYLYPRSSISRKGLMMANSVGIIDRTYRGELLAAVRNMTSQPVKITRGERLFQIVAPNMGHIQETVGWDSLDETARGEGGFGSTGTMNAYETIKECAQNNIYMEKAALEYNS